MCIIYGLWCFVYLGVMPERLVDSMAAGRVLGEIAHVWRVIHLCVMWNIQRERKKHTFKGLGIHIL